MGEESNAVAESGLRIFPEQLNAPRFFPASENVDGKLGKVALVFTHGISAPGTMSTPIYRDARAIPNQWPFQHWKSIATTDTAVLRVGTSAVQTIDSLAFSRTHRSGMDFV